jgi:hypothetical protein
VQRHGKFDDTEARGQMPAGLRDDVDYLLAELRDVAQTFRVIHKKKPIEYLP